MIDPDRRERLAIHLHDICTDEDENTTRADRRAVFLFAAVSSILDHSED